MIDIYKLETLRAIVYFKPCGASHLDSIGSDFSCRYLKIENGLASSVNGRVKLKPGRDLRSIEDIEKIINLMEKK